MKLLEECWQDYIRIFGKTEVFVRNKANRDHLRKLLPHLVQRAKPGMARDLFQIAMEELAKDDWITGKGGNGKHDFPGIVFEWNRVQEYLDKSCGVTVEYQPPKPPPPPPKPEPTPEEIEEREKFKAEMRARGW